MSPLYKGGMSVVWCGQPVEPWGDEWELVDVYDPEVDLLDDLDDWEPGPPQRRVAVREGQGT